MLPLICFHLELLKRLGVGGKLGEVEKVEWKRRKNDINLFMRVRVALPISKPLRRGGFLAGSNGERSWVTFLCSVIIVGYLGMI